MTTFMADDYGQAHARGDERRALSKTAPYPQRPRRRWAVLLAALAVAGITARLGVWQLDRAARKIALQTALEARAVLPPLSQRELMTDAAGDASAATGSSSVRTRQRELATGAAGDSTGAAARLLHRRVVLRGHWLPAHTVWLDNRQMDGRPGFYVVTPLVWPGGAVAVQRGWAPRDAEVRTRLPAVVTPPGEVEVRGRIAGPPARLHGFSPADRENGPIRQNLDLTAWSREIGVALPSQFSVRQEDDDAAGAAGAAGAAATAPTAAGITAAPPPALPRQAAPAAADGLLRRWPPPALDVHKHYGYAFQWFALCALTTGLYVWFQLVRPRRRTLRRPE